MRLETKIVIVVRGGLAPHVAANALTKRFPLLGQGR